MEDINQNQRPESIFEDTQANFKNSTIENGKQTIDRNYRKNQEQIDRNKTKK